MKKLSIISVLFVAVSIALSLFSCTAQTPKANLKTEIDSVSYAFGVANTQGIDQYLLSQGVDSAYIQDFIAGFVEGSKINKEDKKTNARMLGQQIGINVGSSIENISRNLLGDDSTKVLSKSNLLAGFIDGVLNKKFLIPREETQIYLNATTERIKRESLEKQYAKEKEENSKYLEDNKNKEGVVTLPSGLQYKVVKEGNGTKPAATDVVKVNYVGTTIDGKEFDSSVKGGKPAEFALNQVIKGWTEGIQQMSVGSKYILYIPYDLAYGAEGRPGTIPPFATLIFDVDLLEINPAK
ncbi:MAG: FKBP-type peptidyl-prolyl cis-trans isomerase [Candidatus Symbiothrix sp.]|jgi:FKBP-type peptidyl-prolyl cis-trans isomerase FklB|nr:FKBP-type peptidyl-prolyl cis-trans isomerase [Candidatus Symbiothrix sp.]